MFATRAGDLQKMRVRDLVTKSVVSRGSKENKQAAQELMRKTDFAICP